MINKDTILCISISGRPSDFGTTIHNAGFRSLGLNYLYKAFKVTDLAGAVRGIRALGIRGCGVSMPFKESILEQLDELDPMARAIGSVNTVVNENGKLIGYNTDVVGARIVLESAGLRRSDTVLMVGAGGVARAIMHAMRELGFENVLVKNRTEERAAELISGTPYRSLRWNSRDTVKVDLLINATPVGMTPDVESMPVAENLLDLCGLVFDVVLSPPTSKLVRVARSKGKRVIPGYKMALHQAAAQFRLYTGQEAPLAAMEEALLRFIQQ